MNSEYGNILIVDDEEMNRDLAETLLVSWGHKIKSAINGEDALMQLQTFSADLILLDVMMPVMDGFTALKHLKENQETSHIPVIMLTALNDKESIKKALELGANDYLVKPYDIAEFRLRVKNMLNIKRYSDMLNETNLVLEEKVRARTKELEIAYSLAKENELGMIEVLGRAAEFRDNETGAHVQRMSHYSALVGKALGLDHESVELLLYASAMHDVGKIGISDLILLKPGKLEKDEFEEIKKHAQIGYDILSTKNTQLMDTAAMIALTHHEKFDGTGYPKGLKGDEIPLFGRVVAITDVFDALMSERPYKKAFSLEETLSILNEGRGKHFDPKLLDIFIDNIDKVLEIKDHFKDA